MQSVSCIRNALDTLTSLLKGGVAAGERIGMGGTFARTILPAPVSSATYDANNRLTNWNGKTLTYDANGNLLSDGTYTYVWNARDQLTQVKQGNTVVGQYAYDAVGRRYSRTLGNSTTTYLYDGISAVQEKSGNLTTDLFGLGVDNYFSKTTNGSTQTYLTDALGSTLALGDNAGNLTTSYTYGPYGETSQTGAASNNSNQYTGREKDAGNLYYYRARYYSTEFNRFISEDPLGLAAGMNWYAYVGGDPISRRDPLGLWFGWDDAAAIVGGGILGAGSQLVVDALNGKLSSWQDLTGAAVGGAVAGEVLLYTANPFLAGAAGGLTGNLAKQGLNSINNPCFEFDSVSPFLDTGVGALTGFIQVKINSTKVADSIILDGMKLRAAKSIRPVALNSSVHAGRMVGREVLRRGAVVEGNVATTVLNAFPNGDSLRR